MSTGAILKLSVDALATIADVNRVRDVQRFGVLNGVGNDALTLRAFGGETRVIRLTSGLMRIYLSEKTDARSVATAIIIASSMILHHDYKVRTLVRP